MPVWSNNNINIIFQNIIRNFSGVIPASLSSDNSNKKRSCCCCCQHHWSSSLYFQNVSSCWVCVLFTCVSHIRVRIRLGSMGLLSRRLTHRDLSSCSTSLQPSVSIVVSLKPSLHSLRKGRHHLYVLFFIRVHRGLRSRPSLWKC